MRYVHIALVPVQWRRLLADSYSLLYLTAFPVGFPPDNFRVFPIDDMIDLAGMIGEGGLVALIL